MSQLRLVSHIPSRNLKRAYLDDLYVTGLCVLHGDVVLLACHDGGVRALSLESLRLSRCDPCAQKNVYNVAFDAATATLLLVVAEEAARDTRLWLVSLERGTRDWLEVERVQTELTPGSSNVGLQMAGDSRVLLGQEDTDSLYVFDVSAEHRLHDAGTVALEHQLCRFACTSLGSDTLVAVTQYRGKCVLVHRLLDGPLLLKPLARTQLARPGCVLWRGNQLLVAYSPSVYDSHVVDSFLLSGALLMRQRQLLAANTGSYSNQWCLAGDRLCVWEYNSKDLLLYVFE